MFAFKQNTSGQSKPIRDKETKCLTEDQANHRHKKVESVINIDTIKQEME